MRERNLESFSELLVKSLEGGRKRFIDKFINTNMIDRQLRLVFRILDDIGDSELTLGFTREADNVKSLLRSLKEKRRIITDDNKFIVEGGARG